MKVVQIDWYDPVVGDQWCSPDDGSFQPHLCHSIGLLLKDGRRVVRLAGIWSVDGGELEVNATQNIVKRSIHRMQTLCKVKVR